MNRIVQDLEEINNPQQNYQTQTPNECDTNGIMSIHHVILNQTKY